MQKYLARFGGDWVEQRTNGPKKEVGLKPLAELKLEVVYAVATDDAHHYHKVGLGQSNAGRGWVMVRARHLTAESIIHAMEAGDFLQTKGEWQCCRRVRNGVGPAGRGNAC